MSSTTEPGPAWAPSLGLAVIHPVTSAETFHLSALQACQARWWISALKKAAGMKRCLQAVSSMQKQVVSLLKRGEKHWTLLWPSFQFLYGVLEFMPPCSLPHPLSFRGSSLSLHLLWCRAAFQPVTFKQGSALLQDLVSLLVKPGAKISQGEDGFRAPPVMWGSFPLWR